MPSCPLTFSDLSILNNICKEHPGSKVKPCVVSRIGRGSISEDYFLYREEGKELFSLAARGVDLDRNVVLPQFISYHYDPRFPGNNDSLKNALREEVFAGAGLEGIAQVYTSLEELAGGSAHALSIKGSELRVMVKLIDLKRVRQEVLDWIAGRNESGRKHVPCVVAQVLTDRVFRNRMHYLETGGPVRNKERR